MKKTIVLNHKTDLDYENIKYYIDQIKDKIRTDMDIVICPSSIFIPFFNGRYNFKIGCQNIGGYHATGELSGEELKSMGVSYVIVGHSDRKKYYNEDNRLINLKVKECIKNNIIPILCVGETIEEKELKKTQDVIIKQMREAFRDVKVDQDIIIAYEPIWAIGSGITPSVTCIKEIVSMIKNSIYHAHNVNIRVLYGGSITEKNIEKLNSIDELDGFLIGKSSTNPDKIISILNLID